MGFDLSRVLSDEKHYRPLVCSICRNLVSLDALVSNRCVHPFCRQCLEKWAATCRAEQKHCSCPACQADLSVAEQSSDSVTLGLTKVAVLPLEKAQPLAFKLLMLVQVACIERTNKQQCEWFGDYGDFLKHATSHGSDCIAHSFVSTPTLPKSPRKSEKIRSGRPQLKGLRSLSSPSVFSTDKEEGVKKDRIREEVKARLPKTPFRKSMSLKDLASLEREAEPISFDDLLVSPLKRKNTSIATHPDAHKSPYLSSLKDVAPSLVQRKMSGASVGRQLESELKQHGEKAKNDRESDEDESDLEVSYSQATDWNLSINSLNGWNASNKDTKEMETLEEEDEEEESKGVSIERKFEEEDDEHTFASAERIKQILEKSEKLKKQANAKFNKGDFSVARALYTEGITAMSAITVLSDQDRQLLSNMHSNRAVTFFREKKFVSCIEDCDKAIGFDPCYDKSWLRKWRALMALGDFDAAYSCLETASLTIPESIRIQEELNNCQGDKMLLTQARAMLEKGDFQKARDILKPYSRNSDNIGLLFLAARADAGLGHTESALEKVNKALRFNPAHTEGLELRGDTLFLSGETEKGANLLQEAYSRNKDNKKVKVELLRCQRTHSSWNKGRACVKRGRYFEAVDHLSIAIEESGQVPPKAPLFGILRTERAEALLLSKKYIDALKDCQEVINVQEENAVTWSVRADILIALGRAEEAKRELEKIKRTWGADNPTIDEGYRRVDFEIRVLKADEELVNFVEDLQAGKAELLYGDESGDRSLSRLRRTKPSGVDNGDGNSFVSAKERRPAGRAGKERGHERKPSGDTSKRRPHGDSRQGISRSGDRQSHSRTRERSRSRAPSKSRRRLLSSGDRKNDDENIRPKSPYIRKHSVDDPRYGERVANGGTKRRPNLGRKAVSDRHFDRRARSPRRTNSIKPT